MTRPNPIEHEELFDCIILGGHKSPGVVKLSGHDSKVNWDVKDGTAQVGASTTLKNIPLREFKCTFTLSDIEDFDAWAEFEVFIESTVAGSKPKALDIYHPDLASRGIKSVCKAVLGGVEHDGKGGQICTVTFQEYRPPKPKTGSPKGPAKPNDPDAALLNELDNLTGQYNGMSWTK